MAQVSWPTQSIPLDQWDHESDESQRRRLRGSTDVLSILCTVTR